MTIFGEGKLYFGNGEIDFDVTNAETSITYGEEMSIKIEAVESRKKKIGYLPEIKRVIYNSPATIVIWADGTKTIVKKQPGEYYDGEKGLAMCIAKKALGNTSKYYETFKKHDRKKRLMAALIVYIKPCRLTNCHVEIVLIMSIMNWRLRDDFIYYICYHNFDGGCIPCLRREIR